MNENSEKYLERKLCAEVKAMGGIAYKFVSPGRRGVPDRMCVLPGGRVVFVELKSYGKKPTPLQEIEIGRLKDLGFWVFVIDSAGKLDKLISQLKYWPSVRISGKEILDSTKAYQHEKDANLASNALGHARTRNARKD